MHRRNAPPWLSPRPRRLAHLPEVELTLTGEGSSAYALLFAGADLTPSLSTSPLNCRRTGSKPLQIGCGAYSTSSSSSHNALPSLEASAAVDLALAIDALLYRAMVHILTGQSCKARMLSRLRYQSVEFGAQHWLKRGESLAARTSQAPSMATCCPVRPRALVRHHPRQYIALLLPLPLHPSLLHLLHRAPLSCTLCPLDARERTALRALDRQLGNSARLQGDDCQVATPTLFAFCHLASTNRQLHASNAPLSVRSQQLARSLSLIRCRS